MIAEGMKRCTKCGVVKPVEEFYWHDKSHRKRSPRCKPCECDRVMARQGYTRRSPYKSGVHGPERKPCNYCPQCGRRTQNGRKTQHPQLCQKCTRSKASAEYGGIEWQRRLNALACHNYQLPNDWTRKINTLVKSLEIRQRPFGECERRRKRRNPGNWQQRMDGLAHQYRLRDQWTITMETKARNWRRKQRKVTICVKGEFTQVTASIARTGIQMCFDWAKVDT